MQDGKASHPAGTRAARRIAILALAGVSAIAAVVSYFHALAVVQAAGATPPVAYLVPFLADLVILGASAALLDASRQNLSRPRLATTALVAGIGVTLAMNVVASDPHLMPPWLVDAWPAVAFILALESLASILRRGGGVGGDLGNAATSRQSQAAEPPTTVEALRVLLATGSQRKLGDTLGVPKSRVEAWAAITREAPADVPAGEPPPAAAPAPAGAGLHLNGNGHHG